MVTLSIRQERAFQRGLRATAVSAVGNKLQVGMVIKNELAGILKFPWP